MIKVQTVDKIAKIGLAYMDTQKYDIKADHTEFDAIILRSTAIHDMDFPKSLRCIARAGAGVNNIPIDKCTEKGIIVFNTPGANAHAVAELVIAGLFLSSRKIVDGINWAQTLTGLDVAKQVEKGKSAFAGPEISGKRLGVIGLGAIGVLVANKAVQLGMDVMGFDPYMSLEAAWKLSSKVARASDIKEMFAKCDYISLHVPVNDQTKDMVNEKLLKTAKKGLRILNFSRAELVNTKAILDAVNSEVVGCYVTDFPFAEILGHKNVIPIPHLGASTPESEDNCACMAVKEVVEYMETGSITNSVNFPECRLGMPAAKRVCVIHANVPNMVSQISSVFGNLNINIDAIINKSRDNIAYTIVDVQNADDAVLKNIRAIKDVVFARILGE